MKLKDITSVQAQSEFLTGSQAILFEVASSKQERYEFIQRVLSKTLYLSLKRSDKGIVKAFLMKVTGYSRAQLTRLLSAYAKRGRITFTPCTSNGFSSKYTSQDIALLAQMDKRYDCLSGGTTKKLCERAFTVFGDAKFERLSVISVAQLYRLRQTTRYRQLHQSFTKTQPKSNGIGVRKKPFTGGRAGFIRIDTVHQGDLDNTKGVYHINAVDEVTQYQVVMSVGAISERFLQPVLEEILATFPFVVLGFHSDNGSEYINGTVATLLNKLHVELTKSRARKSNDNALVESKNASVVRKLFGYHHIPQRYAEALNDFHRQHLVSYLNYHRPCYFPKIVTDKKGKQRRTYPIDLMMTPYEKLKSLAQGKYTLKPGIDFKTLDEEALKISDNEAKDQLNVAYKQLTHTITTDHQRAI